MRKGPLAGRRIVVTRPPGKIAEAVAAIEALGGVPVALPAIAIDREGPFPEFEAALAAIGDYDLVVVTSANAARALADGLSGASVEAGGQAWRCVAIGKATAAALAEAGIAVDALPDEAVAERLPDAVGEVSGRRVLIPASDIARGAVGRELERRGARVDEVVAYRTVAAPADPRALAELEGGVDAVLLTSPSTVRGFDAMTAGRYRKGRALVACIGPVTADEALDLGYRVDLVPADHSLEGLLAGLAERWDGDSDTVGSLLEGGAR